MAKYTLAACIVVAKQAAYIQFNPLECTVLIGTSTPHGPM